MAISLSQLLSKVYEKAYRPLSGQPCDKLESGVNIRDMQSRKWLLIVFLLPSVPFAGQISSSTKKDSSRSADQYEYQTLLRSAIIGKSSKRNTSNTQNTWSFADLLKRKLYDLASFPQNPSIIIASSSGIFLTSNGKSWHKLTSFGDNNFPVLFSTKGTLFVGGYRSDDFGKSFKPLYKWDTLASLIIQATKQSPYTVRVEKWEEYENHLIMTVDVGNSTNVRLLSKDDGATWSAYKEAL